MQRHLARFRHVLKLVGIAEIILAAFILTGIVLMIIAQVALNAGLGNPLTWEQEAGAYALVWLTFVGASAGLKQMRHITIVSFVGRLPHRPRALVRAAVFATMLWMYFILMRELIPIMEIEARATTVALPFDLPRSYFFSVPLLATSAMMALTTTLYFLEALLTASASDRTADIVPVME